MVAVDLHMPVVWQGFGLSDIGLVRSSNQDAFAVENEIGLWVIADGMGGHAGGSIASSLAVSAIVEHVRALRWSISHEQHAFAHQVVAEAISVGDKAIHQRTISAPDLIGMGTTVVAALLCPGDPVEMAVAHVGDSRAYLIRNDTIQSLTTDHSLVQQLLTEGQITPEQAITHSQQHILLRALGAEDEAKADIKLHALEPQDIILLCTDGLTKTVSEREMLSIVSRHQSSPAHTCRNLIDAANNHGGKDNTTVVVISASDRKKGDQ
jgi:PPM family protein phosphatase